MNSPTDRRTVLVTAGAAAVAAVAGPTAAQAADIRGTITFNDGAAIPAGQLEIYLDDPAAKDKAQLRATKTSLKSDGASKTIDFSLPALAAPTASPTQRIIARLERADGWLLARGSGQIDAGSPVSITLNTVMY